MAERLFVAMRSSGWWVTMQDMSWRGWTKAPRQRAGLHGRRWANRPGQR